MVRLTLFWTCSVVPKKIQLILSIFFFFLLNFSINYVFYLINCDRILVCVFLNRFRNPFLNRHLNIPLNDKRVGCTFSFDLASLGPPTLKVPLKSFSISSSHCIIVIHLGPFSGQRIQFMCSRYHRPRKRGNNFIAPKSVKEI